jgi:TolA-binding protein
VQRTDRRLNRLEGEMRAVQRKVFPGGASMVAPEIVPPAASAADGSGAGASNPLVDMTRRVGEMEQQLRTLTAMKRTRGDVEYRLTQLEGGETAGAEGAAAVGALGAAAIAPETPAGSATIVTPAAASAPPPPPPPPAPPAATQPGARPGAMVPAVGTAPVAAAAVAPAPEPEIEQGPAVAKGDSAADDWKAGYIYALNKDWPLTEAHMRSFTANWPDSFRMAQAYYWLGRSYAEREQHAQAADAYLKVYNDYPKAGRAPDALIGLAGALLGIENPTQACRVLGELQSVYPDKMGATRSADAKALSAKAKCG